MRIRAPRCAALGKLRPFVERATYECVTSGPLQGNGSTAKPPGQTIWPAPFWGESPWSFPDGDLFIGATLGVLGECGLL